MNLIKKRNFILFLAAALVVAFGIMSLYLDDKKTKMTQQSQQAAIPQGGSANSVQQPAMKQTDSVKDIETDLDKTDLNSMDKDLQEMEKEINTSF